MDGMSVALSEEHRMIKDLVARFVADELMPLERAVLEREAAGQGYSLTS
jgi:acyl-CoA dehydrogenase